MTKAAWKKQIEEACRTVGTYRECFDAVIDTLADILWRRDKAWQQFKKEGYELLVCHTNKAGAENVTQNPLVRVINELNRDALAYWRELGLTPAGLKKLNDSALKVKENTSPLQEALARLGGS